MKLKNILSILAAAGALLSATPGFAVNYDLTTAMATINGGNETSSFLEVTGAGVVSGSAAGLYTAEVGGSEAAGWWVKILFGANPQPVLTYAFLKAGNFFLSWDAADLAAFNAGVFDSITMWNSGAGGIKNPPGNAYLGTSHAGLDGEPGTRVPDATSTLALLGLGLASLGLIARSRKA